MNKRNPIAFLAHNLREAQGSKIIPLLCSSGVESTAFQGQEKDKIEVVGDGIDAVALTTSLRKNVGFAELVSVSAVDDKKEAEPKPTQPDVIWSTHPYVYSGAAPYHVYGVRDCSYDPSCTIM